MAKKQEELISITDLKVQNPAVSASLSKFEGVKAQMDLESSKLNLIEIKDETTLSILEQSMSKLNDLVVRVEEVRVSEKKPHLDNCNAIDNAAKYVVTASKKSILDAKDRKVVWIKAIEAENKRKQDIQDKIDAMSTYFNEKIESEDLTVINKMKTTFGGVKLDNYAERSKEVEALVLNFLKIINIRIIELDSLGNASPDEQEAIKESLEEAKQAVQETVQENKVAQESLVSFSTPKKTRRPWTYEILDLTKVPREWLILDEDKVKEYIKVNGDTLVDGQVLSGIKYFKDIRVTV